MAADPALPGSGKASEELTVLDFYVRGAIEGGMVEFFHDNLREVWRDYDDFAVSCFNVAEAMLRERQRRKG